MTNSKTLTDLRNRLKGKIYIYLDNTDICKKFLQDAEQEGYRFGKIKPTESKVSDIIAIDYNKQLSYVNFIGRIVFQCNGGSNNNDFHRIDYLKLLKGNKDYLF